MSPVPTLLLLALMCTVAHGAAGQIKVHLSDINRDYVVINPNGVQKSPAPALLLWFHGLGGNCEKEGSADALKAAVEARSPRPNMLVVAMCGVNGAWNIYEQNWANSNELKYVRRVIAAVHTSYNVNTASVYAAGFSMGGMMASSIACHAPELVIGVNYNGCGLACPIPVSPMFMLAVQGLQDNVCPQWARLSFDTLAGAMGCLMGSGNRRSIKCKGKELQLVQLNGGHTVIDQADFHAYAQIVQQFVYAMGNWSGSAPKPDPNPNPVPADACKSFDRRDSKEVSGSDLVDMGGVAMFDACADLCKRTARCRGFVERTGGGMGTELHCLLKTAVPAGNIKSAPATTSLGTCRS